MSVVIKEGYTFNAKDVLTRSGFANHPTAEETLRKCLYKSVEIRYGTLENGMVVCVWGLIPPTILSDSAYLWLLTTDLVEENKFLFVRNSQRYIEEVLKIYPTIVGEVVVGNWRAKRWLAWLGAKFGGEYDGKIPFVIKAKKND